MPLEYFTLAFDMPFMLLLGDIRQGVFYAVLLSFWLVFAGEHLMVRISSELLCNVNFHEDQRCVSQDVSK